MVLRAIFLSDGPSNLQNFFTRKRFYKSNAMVIANDRKKIFALDIDWHGSAQNARECGE
jgi:hypothetical protein